MQVPGPPRYGSSLGYSYGSSPPGMPPQHHGVVPTQAAWRQPLPMAMQVPGGGGMRARGSSDGQFNPAPGPPSKPNHVGGSSAAGQPGGALYDYTGQPAAIMVNPFMMQHPFMMAAPTPGQPAQGGGWAPAGMVTAQHAGAWYAPPPPAAAGRGGMQMVAPYTYAGGYTYAAQPPPPSSGMPGRRAPGPSSGGRLRQSGQEHPLAHVPVPSPVVLEQTSSSAGDTGSVSRDENSGPLQQQGSTTAAQQQPPQQASPAPDKVLVHNDSGGGGAGGDDKQVLAVQ